MQDFEFKPTQPTKWSEHFQKPDEEKTREAFLMCIKLFKSTRGKRGGGHIEFIKAALRSLSLYKLEKDLEIYKELFKVFPEGEYVPKDVFQKAFWYYPQHQECALELLDELEWNGVHPDKELNEIVSSRFGAWNVPAKKVKRQLYWLPKLRYTNRYLDRRLVENKKLLDVELARIALRMVCRDAGTQITSFKATFTETEARGHNNWIVSAQSPLQKRLISNLDESTTCYIDGPTRIWVRDKSLHYVVLSSTPTTDMDEEFLDLRSAHKFASHEELRKKMYSVESQVNIHQQADQTILALAVLGVDGSHDFASAWLHHLQEENPQLSKINVLFRLKRIQKGVYIFEREGCDRKEERVC